MRYVSEFEVSGEVHPIKDKEARTEIDELTKHTNNEINRVTNHIDEEVDRLTKYIDDAKLTELVVIGDSFTKGITAGGVVPKEQQLPTLLGKYLDLTVHNYGISEYGYTIPGKLFMTQAQTAEKDTSYDHNKVKYVAIIGGINDVNFHSDGDIAGSANALRSYLQGIYRNAKIVQFPCWGGVSFTLNNSWKVFGALGYGDDPNTPVYYYPELTTALVGYPQYVSNDDVHPTGLGYVILAKCMVALLNGTYYEQRRNCYITGPKAHPGWDTSNLTIYMDKDTITFDGVVTATETITVDTLDVCDIPAPFTFPHEIAVPIQRNDLSGKASVGAMFTPPLTLSSWHTIGQIRVFTDAGVAMVKGTNLQIHVTVRRRPF